VLNKIEIQSGSSTKVQFQHFDPVESLKKLLDSHFHHSSFVKDAKKIYTESNDRVWKTADTADWWNSVQVMRVYGF